MKDLFDKVKSATKRSIDLTDPETYKKDPGDLSSIGKKGWFRQIKGCQTKDRFKHPDEE